MEKNVEKQALTVISEKETAIVENHSNSSDNFDTSFDTDIADVATQTVVDISNMLAIKKASNLSNAVYWAPYADSGLIDAISIKGFLADADNDFAIAEQAKNTQKMQKAFNEASKYRKIATYLGMAVIDAMYDGKISPVTHAFFVDKFTGGMFKMAQKEVLSKLSAKTTSSNGEQFQNFVKGQLLCIEYKGKVTKTKTYHSFEITQVSFK